MHHILPPPHSQVMFTSPAPTTTTITAGSFSLAAATNVAASQSHLQSHSSVHSRPQTHDHESAAPTTAASRTRRGLSYLRSYTQNHLLSRDHNSHTTSSTSPPSTTAASPTSSSFGLARGLSRSISDNISRSATATATATATDTPADIDRPTDSRRFTLVPTHTPSTATSAHDGEQSQSSRPTAGPSFSQQPVPSQGIESTGRRSMTRSRSATTGTVMAASSSANRTADDGSNIPGVLPSIRFSVFVDPRSQRPSLHFAPIARTLPASHEVIRVGRYSERDSQPQVSSNVPSAAPVGFKSKVVSRRHCEFWYEEGKWYIKDVKSSSGTFLNHIRLSPPGQESKPFPVNDGDVVQLGIDFKGGEEMIFRCVKMRLELNRGWQNKLNKFNMSSHKRLWNMTKSDGSNQNYSQDCSICLNSIAPCQCLFVAPCSHTWHFKCIRALLQGPNYPIFICPNCRAAADLEAEVEDPEDWEQLNDEVEGDPNEASEESRSKEPRLDPPAQVEAGRASIDRIRTSLERARASAAERARTSLERSRSGVPPMTPAQEEQDPGASASTTSENVVMADAGISDGEASTPSTTESSHAISDPVPIPTGTPGVRRTPSPGSGLPTGNGHEGPITPRNDAGPWVSIV